jgi:hypothetical protein
MKYFYNLTREFPFSAQRRVPTLDLWQFADDQVEGN